MRTLILILMIVYVLSPVDFYPGPLDDILVLILGSVLRNRMEKEEERT